ncbi:small ribosomal subunit biogenesis GTPase RsgA 1, mitochondrial [Cynara cardunculus var. scolymus]|uniref:EngC GTPase n=1 Tax=Cynara cardunculus var. scolymus TaxID=59895 RepID=A0A103YAX5_CYNCS|nr:small ribosomal subunit biogenesis GTPase RsgA 1, mitochondrial [Cynara cardunculus var. scolymus]KVI05734.1 EngC GTPase [Cynara cardunculus var. scolymus]
MSSFSISIIRHHYNPFIPNTVHRCASGFRSLWIAASRNHNRENVSRKSQQPSKHLLKARDAVKHFSSLSPSLTSTDKFSLSPDQAIGKVASAQANFMRVVVESAKSLSPEEEKGNGVELLCVVRNLLKKIKRRVLVGDKVLVGSIDWIDRRGMIENVFERKTEVLDPPVANVDHLLVLFSLDQPKLEEFSLTRFLVEAESTQIPVTLALNKVELVDKETQVSWKSKLRSWGYEPIFCSVETKTGLDSLQFNLRDQTSVIVGPSGVGKSSLINALRSNHFGFHAADMNDWPNSISGSKWLEDQRVGEVSARSGRGKHTTRHVSLLPLSGGGYIADTPGFNQPSLLKVTTQSLALCFPEVRKILSASEPSRCAFSNCLHLGEPGCLVKDDWERHPYYFQLLDEVKIREEFQLRTLGTKREGDVRYKMGDMGIKQAEPRLEMKKHRRQSRKKVNQSFLDDLEEELEDDDESFLEDDPIIRAMENENQ